MPLGPALGIDPVCATEAVAIEYATVPPSPNIVPAIVATITSFFSPATDPNSTARAERIEPTRISQRSHGIQSGFSFSNAYDQPPARTMSPARPTRPIQHSRVVQKTTPPSATSPPIAGARATV